MSAANEFELKSRQERVEVGASIGATIALTRRKLLSRKNAAKYLGVSETQFILLITFLGLKADQKLWNKHSKRNDRTRWDPKMLDRLIYHPEVVAARERRPSKKPSGAVTGQPTSRCRPSTSSC